MKTCSKCKEEKLFSEFSKNKSRKGGYHNICKICVKEYYDVNRNKIILHKQEYYQANKAKIAIARKEYQKANKGKILEYLEANKNKIADQQIKYRELNKDKLIDYRKNNKEKIKNQSKEYREANKDKIADYYKAKRESYLLQFKEYYKSNKNKFKAKNAKRRAQKLNATPKWLTKEELQQIEELYEIAQAFKLYTGQEYHVDHIVPLQGENVCGLHVPWNLQILEASENLSKHNKLLEE